MRNFFLITLGKWVSNLSLTLNLGSGSTWPGHFALKQNRNFIKQLLKKSHTKIVLIAGTNGKTTTSTLITHMLLKNGKTVVQNTSGANLLSGIASTLLLNTNKHGTLDADYAVFEVDENALPPLLKQLTPNTLILLNLFRDQLDRYGEVNSIVTHWSDALKSLPNTTTLILNADDPEIAYIGLCHPGVSQSETIGSQKHMDSIATLQNDNVRYFGLDDKTLGQTTFQHASDSIYCPKCHTKLTYSTRFFSHLGIWKCESCKLTRPALSPIQSSTYPLSGIYNRYNTHAAVLFAKEQGFGKEQIEKSLSGFTAAFGRQEVVSYYGKKVQLFLSKNPTSFNQSLRTIKELGGKYLLLALNDRAPDGTDVSWIWDTDIEEYLNPDGKLYVSGDRCFDMGLRIKYASESQNAKVKSQIYEDLQKAIDDAIADMPQDETLFILPTYSAMLEARKIITGRKNVLMHFAQRVISRLLWAQKEFLGTIKTEKIYDDLAQKNEYDMVVDYKKRTVGFTKALKILKSQPKNVLDLATGTGAMISALLTTGNPYIIGTDISEKMLQTAKKRFEKYKNISFKKQDFLADTFGKQTFDLITLCFAARFIPKEKEESFAKLVTKLLDKNGSFVILTMTSPEKVFYEITEKLFGFPKGMNVSMDNEDHLKKLLGRYLTFEKSVPIQTQMLMYQTKALYFKKK